MIWNESKAFLFSIKLKISRVYFENNLAPTKWLLKPFLIIYSQNFIITTSVVHSEKECQVNHGLQNFYQCWNYCEEQSNILWFSWSHWYMVGLTLPPFPNASGRNEDNIVIFATNGCCCNIHKDIDLFGTCHCRSTRKEK